jgi:pyruvyltransferase
MLSPEVIEYLDGERPVMARRDEKGKLIAIGSIIHTVQDGDTVFGTGWKGDKIPDGIKTATVLAVRGPITRQAIIQAGGTTPEVYGDPALLMPLVYRPNNVVKKYQVGYIPHYIDDKFTKDYGEGLVINVLDDWKKVIDQILSCEMIVSSSLHGIILSEAYGIPAVWAVWGDKIVGGRLKYDDYFLGTGRRRLRS